MSFNIWAISMQIQLLFHQCWSFQRKQGTRDSHSYCWEGWNRGDWSNVYKYLYKVFQHELFQCIFSFYFFSAEAFKTIKVHLMHIPIAQRNGTMTIGATRFAYVYRRSFNMWAIWLYFQLLLLQCWSFQNNQGTPDAHSYRKKEWNDDDCGN